MLPNAGDTDKRTGVVTGIEGGVHTLEKHERHRAGTAETYGAGEGDAEATGIMTTTTVRIEQSYV